VDITTPAIILADGPSGEILNELSFAPELTPTELAVTPDYTKAYLPCAATNGKNSILAVNLSSLALYSLPIVIPYPAQFVLPETSDTIAYLAEPCGNLHRLDLTTMSIELLGAPAVKASCVGLAADAESIYTAWEHAAGGTIMGLKTNGNINWQYDIAGIPTNIILAGSRLLVPFTNTAFTGEGVALFNVNKKSPSPAVVTIQCPSCPSGLAAYPCHAALAADNRTAYIINEDSASICVIDLETAQVVDRLTLGRSLSRLYLLPDSHLALGTSNLFADLSLIDLTNGSLLAVTNTKRQLLSTIAILP
jgi:DNA-binding beta-propeller fold protein YncE